MSHRQREMGTGRIRASRSADHSLRHTAELVDHDVNKTPTYRLPHSCLPPFSLGTTVSGTAVLGQTAEDPHLLCCTTYI